jgi:hypothetical protein
LKLEAYARNGNNAAAANALFVLAKNRDVSIEAAHENAQKTPTTFLSR